MSLLTVGEVQEMLGLDPQANLRAGLTVYSDAAGASSATAQVSSAPVATRTITLIITGGAQAGTVVIDLNAAATETLAELVAVIDALPGWVATIAGSGQAAPASSLTPTAALGALGMGTLQTLTYDGDQWRLARYIAQAEARIETYTNRAWSVRTVREYLPVQPGAVQLFPTRTPIRQVFRVATRSGRGLEIWNPAATDLATVEAFTFRAAALGDRRVYLRARSGATLATSSLTIAATLTALAAAVIAAGSGWTAAPMQTTDGPLFAGDLWDLPATDASAGRRVLLAWAEPVGDALYYVDGQSSICFPGGVPEAPALVTAAAGVEDPLSSRGQVLVEYEAGMDTIPDDVLQTALDLIKMMLTDAKLSPGLQSESIGDYSYTRGRAASEVETEFLRSRLNKWRVWP